MGVSKVFRYLFTIGHHQVNFEEIFAEIFVLGRLELVTDFEGVGSLVTPYHFEFFCVEAFLIGSGDVAQHG